MLAPLDDNDDICNILLLQAICVCEPVWKAELSLTYKRQWKSLKPYYWLISSTFNQIKWSILGLGFATGYIKKYKNRIVYFVLLNQLIPFQLRTGSYYGYVCCRLEFGYRYCVQEDRL